MSGCRKKNTGSENGHTGVDPPITNIGGDGGSDNEIVQSDGAVMELPGFVPPQAPANPAVPGGGRKKLSPEGESGGTGGDTHGDFLSNVRVELDKSQHPRTSEKLLTTTLDQPPHDVTEIAAELPQRALGNVLNVGSPLDDHPPSELLYDIEFSKEPDHEREDTGRLKAEVGAKTGSFRRLTLDTFSEAILVVKT